MKCVPYSMYVTSKAQIVGARKKWRATTSQETAIVIGMMSQAVARPDQSAILSIASIVALTAGATSSGVCARGTGAATRFPPSLQGLESSPEFTGERTGGAAGRPFDRPLRGLPT